MKKRYQTGYSTRSLMLKEFDAILSSVDDFEAFISGNEKIDIDIIPVNSERSKKIVLTEVNKRVRSLAKPVFLELFINGSPKDRALVLFYSVCKAYQLIPDFVIDTVLPKWYNMDKELTSYDFKAFIFRISESHPEFECFTEKNLSNISSATIKILREAGMLNKNTLVKMDYNERILKEIVCNGDSWFLEVLLLNESERQEIIGQ
ncbi:MAG: DUF1819 family protein [Breznakibacter sp.]